MADGVPTLDYVLSGARDLQPEDAVALAADQAGLERKIIQSRGRLQKQKHKIELFWMLLQDGAAGRYNLAWEDLRLVAYVFHYLLRQKDLIPDSVPVAGLSDDLAVIVLVFEFLEPKLEQYAQAKGLVHSDYFCINS
jgi:uncharacterized membrane protein YkvA (DUF1232 family)